MTKSMLNKFCQWSINEALKNPFSLGDYTYSTDGCILIKIPRIDDIPENKKAPNPEELEHRKPQKWYKVEGYKMPIAECSYCGGKGKNFECFECHGVGTVFLENQYNYYDNVCVSCNGTGKIKFCENCDGTGQIIAKKITTFHGIYFNQKYLALLSELPNCEMGLISGKKASLFRFDGGTGIIMPMVS